MKVKQWLTKETKKTYDYETQRLFIGLTAFLLPFLATLVFGRIISSISAYYYTNSRDIFVGILCITGLFLLVYNGRFNYEALISKLAGICAIGTALAPTGFPADIIEHREELKAIIVPAEMCHYVFSISLFVLLIFLCFCFARRAKQKGDKQAKRRRIIYLICAGLMSISLLLYPILWIIFPFTKAELNQFHLLFFMESIALLSFGIAWLTAGKPLKHWNIKK